MDTSPESRPKKRRGGSPKGVHTSPATEWKPGQSGNPAGGIRKGMSRAEVIRAIDAMTPEEMQELFRRMGGKGNSGLERSLATLPKKVPFIMLEHTSATVANICEPSASMLGYKRDTTDGKPIERQEITGADGSPLIPATINFVRRRRDG